MRILIASLVVVFSVSLADTSFAAASFNGTKVGNGMMANGINMGNGTQTGASSKWKGRKASRNGGTVTSVQMPAR